MILFLQVLPTEILYEIFDYLTPFDILYSFIHLNKRINGIVKKYPLQLDFQYISRSKFDFICRYIQPEQVISIYLSDDQMPNQVELFNKYFPNFYHQFIRLRRIKFIDTSTILSYLPKYLSSLSIKTYSKTNNTDQLIMQILTRQTQYLTYLKVDGSYVFRSINTSFPLLTHLIIDYCTVTDFHRIVHYLTSSLTHLKLFIDKEDHFSILDFKQLSKSLKHLTLLFSSGRIIVENFLHTILSILEILMSFELIKQYLDQLFTLTYLTIQATGTLNLMDGQSWEEYLLRTKIKRFNFKFTLSSDFVCHEDRDSLLQSFRSSFWLEKNHWHVVCDKGSLKSSRPTIYSLPYFQSSMIIYPSSHFLSNSTNETEIISKHPINLILTYHRTITIPITPFIYVYSLTLLSSTLLSIDTLQSIVNLKQIREFDLSLIKHYSIEEFQMLIDSMSNLNHIKMQFNPLFLPPLHIDSYTFAKKDEERFVIGTNNIHRFSYLFFHIKNLEITVQSKDVIIRLLNQLHYLETIKIFCYEEYLLDIKYNWFLTNIPRLNTIYFTHRITASCMFLSIGDRKVSYRRIL
jgi:hypothetical protein